MPHHMLAGIKECCNPSICLSICHHGCHFRSIHYGCTINMPPTNLPATGGDIVCPHSLLKCITRCLTFLLHKKRRKSVFAHKLIRCWMICKTISPADSVGIVSKTSFKDPISAYCNICVKNVVLED